MAGANPDRASELSRNLEEVRAEIAESCRRSGRSVGEVTLVAVSKFHPAGDVRALAGAGQRSFGESYAQEAGAKIEELSDLGLDWHFIGGLQTNKAKYVAGRYSLVHSVDSEKLARALHRKAGELGLVQNVLMQVNLGGELQKSGVSEAGASELAEAVMGLDGLSLRGLMLLPPFFDDPEAARPYFAALRGLRDRLEASLGVSLPHLSMGMTGDFRAAVEEGATIVRVGTRIFGSRG